MAKKKTKRQGGFRVNSETRFLDNGMSSNYDSGLSRRNTFWRGQRVVDFGEQTGFPDRLRTTLKYTQDVTLSGSASPTPQIFRMNSPYDPDASGTGGQPEYYDIFSGLYDRYCVLGAKARISLKNNSTPGIDLAAAFLPVLPTSPSAAQVAEMRYSKLVSVTSSPSYAVLEMPAMKTSTILGTPNPLNDPDIRSQVAAVPNREWLLFIKADASNGSSTIDCRIHVEIWMDVVFVDFVNIKDALEIQSKHKGKASHLSHSDNVISQSTPDDSTLTVSSAMSKVLGEDLVKGTSSQNSLSNDQGTDRNEKLNKILSLVQQFVES